MVMRMGRILGKIFGYIDRILGKYFGHPPDVKGADVSNAIPPAILASYVNRPDNVTLMYEIEMEDQREPVAAAVGAGSQSNDSGQAPYAPDVSDMEHTSPGTSWDVSDMGYDPSAAVEAPWQIPPHAPAEPESAGVGSRPCGAPIPDGHCMHMVLAGADQCAAGHHPR